MALTERYFISPEYEDRLIKLQYDKSCQNDKRDSFSFWLAENSIPHFVEGLGETYRGGKLMGENGVYCEITTGKSRLDVSGKVERDSSDNDSGAYRRVVRVLAVPGTKPLPKELLEALVSREYAEAGVNNPCVKEIMRRLK